VDGLLACNLRLAQEEVLYGPKREDGTRKDRWVGLAGLSCAGCGGRPDAGPCKGDRGRVFMIDRRGGGDFERNLFARFCPALARDTSLQRDIYRAIEIEDYLGGLHGYHALEGGPAHLPWRYVDFHLKAIAARDRFRLEIRDALEEVQAP
jgi:hypothetical protein